MSRIDEHIAPSQTAAAGKPALDAAQKQRLQKAVKDFEAVLVGFMLKNMRGSIQKEGMFGESFGGDLMDGMFDSELAQHVSQSSSFGIANTLYRQITGEKLPEQVLPIMEWNAMLAEHAPVQMAPAKAVNAVPADKSRVTPPATVESAPAPAKSVPVPAKSVAVPAKSAGAISGKTKDRIESYATIIDTAAQKHGIDPNLVRAVIATESAGKIDARSSKQAKGLMQLIDSTASDMGVRNVWDPQENINGGTKYLKQMLERFDGDLKLALASYNAGPGAVERHKGVPPFRETRDYVNRVMRYLQLFTEEVSSNAE